MKSGATLAMTALVVGIGASASAQQAVSIPENTNWTSYNENVNGQRYVPLNQITRDNAAELGEVCRLKVEDVGAFHTGILEIDGVLYFTTSTDTLAVDATNCKQLWRHHYETEEPGGTALQVNRGLAYANGKLYRGTVDARFLAIDAKTGQTVWKYQVGDPKAGEFFSAAPQIYQGLVFTSAAGGDWGIRGRVVALDAATGREVWRFYTVPRGDEPGAETWKDADSARYGGGGSWTTYTLDMASGELFVPVGNPAPDLLPHLRQGENLYTNSLVVLDANTGKVKWYHQLLGNDGQDLDLGAAPMLYYNSKGERMVAFGGKDGYLYGVNRETLKREFKTPVTTIKNAGVAPTREGIDVCPGPLGGVEWNGPAYDKPNKAIVVGSVDWCARLTADEGYTYKPGEFAMGGQFKFADESRGWIVSADQDLGSIRWKYETVGPQVSGLVPTGGGVILAGDMKGHFIVLDSSDGRELLKRQVGGALAGGTITYMRKGKQYVAFVAGNVSRMTFGVTGSPTLVIYALGAKNAPKLDALPVALAANDKPDPAAGQALYAKVCAACHGPSGEGGTGPSLKGVSKRLDFVRTVQWIENPSAKMPKLYPTPLDAQAVRNVAAYLQGM
ncbi:MAG: PQQ-binding-like beta-propeller repeat protein [Gammaproteobacteria bacterium]|nr:PQQ-binding-like beta-propeller repeat protein [Gammaproteobacteria bacterium]